MQEITKTDSHIISVDTAKNHIYLTVTGKSLLESPTFVEDWEKAKRLVSPGFRVFTDASQILHMSEDWLKAVGRLHKMLIQADLTKVAEILSENTAAKFVNSAAN